jgi:hypothetical protein
MIPLGHAALLACVALGIVLFRYYPGHRLVIGMYVVGVLFLPEFGSHEFIEGVPPPLNIIGVHLTKPNAISLGLLVGSLLYDRRRWLAGRFRWFDLPMVVWCVGPLVSALANSLIYDDPATVFVPTRTDRAGDLVSWLVTTDFYDGVARSVDVVLTWGVPYCLGRLYISDAEKLRELVIGFAAGTVLYAPFCVAEMVLSPQLHRWVYGFHQHEFLQSIRFDGYRPMVFLEHGLAVGVWMVLGALAAAWLWARGSLRRVRVPYVRGDVNGLWVVAGLALVAVGCKSTGALALGFLGLVTLAAARSLRHPLPAVLLLCIPPLYVTARTAGLWDAKEVVSLSSTTAGRDRAQSLEFRLQNESMLVQKALERPLVGWSGWGRSRIYDEDGKAVTIADGLWIVTLGERGSLGLVSLGLILALPVALALHRHGPPLWTDVRSAAVAVAAVLLALYAIDCLMNAMLNPVFLVMAGGLMALRPDESAAQTREDAQTPTAWRVRPDRPQSRITPRRPHFRIVSKSAGHMLSLRNPGAPAEVPRVREP